MDLFAEAGRNDHVRTLVRQVNEFFADSVTALIEESKEARMLTPRHAAELIIDTTHGMMIRSITDASILTATEIRERHQAMLRRLWPLLFTHPAPAARSERASS
jgi:hypothetical protein